jgi:glycosyltransferase involved in cell wall biosynthesis
MKTPALSAIICTHNPRSEYLWETLASIRAQQPLSGGRRWELLIIDNASEPALDGRVDLAWHSDARIIREPRLGLTHARHRSFHEARGDILVYIDDDNVLDPHYLRLSLDIFDRDPRLGAIGGKALPRWERQPPEWFTELGISLACRDLGDHRIDAKWDEPKSADRSYPHCAPVGAGMGIRRSAYAAYVKAALRDPVRIALGRRGADLSSGEDNDMILSILANGWTVAYLPELRLEHLIPANRLSTPYLERYAQSSNRTWVQVLDVHGMSPWDPVQPWTVPLRKARAWFRERAWRGPVNRIRWRAACGIFEGRSTLFAVRKQQ